MKIINLHDIHNKIDVLATTFEKIKHDFENEVIKPVLTFCGDFVDNPSDQTKKKKNIEIIRDMIWEMEDLGFKTIATPGNHDVGKSGIFYNNDDKNRFYKLFQLQRGEINYIEHENVYIIALDSTAGSNQTLMAAGRIGKEQLQKFEKVCKDIGYFKKKVVIMHHHAVKRANHLDAKGMELVDAEEYAKVAIRNRILLTLHGHRHSYQGLYRKNGILTYTSGSLKNDSKYSIVEIKENEEIWASNWK